MSKHSPSHALGQKIKKLRKAKRLAQKNLADAIGRSTETVSNIERGVHSPRMGTVLEIAKALEVEMHELFLVNAPLGAKEKQAVMEKIFELLKDRPLYFLNATFDQINVLVSVDDKGKNNKRA